MVYYEKQFKERLIDKAMCMSIRFYQKSRQKHCMQSLFLFFFRDPNNASYENYKHLKGDRIMEVVSMKEIKREARKRELKEKFNAKIQNGKEWFIRNKETVIALTPVVIGGLTTIIKVVSKRINLAKEEELKDLYCYDRSLGHYWQLRRELTNKEWLEIDKRKKNGERLSDILDEMKVLK